GAGGEEVLNPLTVEQLLAGRGCPRHTAATLDPLLGEIRVFNFRSARSLALRPGSVCAFIGQPGAGKSNLLFALRALLDPGFDLSTADVSEGQRAISIEAPLAGGGTISLGDQTGAPPIVHFPTDLRGSDLASAPHGDASADVVGAVMREAVAQSPARGVAVVRGLEACVGKASGVVFAIEERELFLAPQAHRYLRRLFARLADAG